MSLNLFLNFQFSVSEFTGGGVNRGMQIHRSVVILGPICQSDVKVFQIRVHVSLKFIVRK